MRYLLARGGYVKGDWYPGDQNCSILGSRVNSDVHGGIGKAWTGGQNLPVTKIKVSKNLLIVIISTFCECAELCVSCKLLQKPYQALFVNIRWSLSWEGTIILFSYFRYFETKMSFAAGHGRTSCHIWVLSKYHTILVFLKQGEKPWTRQIKMSLAAEKADEANFVQIVCLNLHPAKKANILPNWWFVQILKHQAYKNGIFSATDFCSDRKVLWHESGNDAHFIHNKKLFSPL